MKPHLTIYRMFTEAIADLGFARERTAWWKRTSGALVQGIHLHKFSFTTSFRVHSAIHLADFDAPGAPWLNGMSSYDGWYESPRPSGPFRRSDPPLAHRYSFDYTESSGSWQPCADELFAFTRDILVPWFERWADTDRLLNETHSPLTHDQRAFLNRA
jgi:hypothetical protein